MREKTPLNLFLLCVANNDKCLDSQVRMVVPRVSDHSTWTGWNLITATTNGKEGTSYR
jgi:hypothetical protein